MKKSNNLSDWHKAVILYSCLIGVVIALAIGLGIFK